MNEYFGVLIFRTSPFDQSVQPIIVEETPSAMNQPQIPIHNVQPFQLQMNSDPYNPVTAYYILTAEPQPQPQQQQQTVPVSVPVQQPSGPPPSVQQYQHQQQRSHTSSSYYNTAPPVINSQLAVPNNDENLPPRTSSRIGVSRSFDSLLSNSHNHHNHNNDKLSVDTGYYGQGPYTDDEMLLKDTASKVAPAGYGQGLAPRRSSTTALDYHYGSGPEIAISHGHGMCNLYRICICVCICV